LILFAALGIAWGIPYLFIKIPFVLLTGAWPAVWPSTPVVVSIIVLAVVCSVFAFLAMVALVAEIGPVQATAVTYVNPAVALPLIAVAAADLGGRIAHGHRPVVGPEQPPLVRFGRRFRWMRRGRLRPAARPGGRCGRAEHAVHVLVTEEEIRVLQARYHY